MKHGGLPTEDDYGGYLGQVNYSEQSIDQNIIQPTNIVYRICKIKDLKNIFLFRTDIAI